MRKTTQVSTRCQSDRRLFRRSWCSMLARDRVPAPSFPVNLLLQIADVRVDLTFQKASMDLQTLQEMSAEKLDELFSDSEAGAIPEGPMEGTVLLSGRRHRERPADCSSASRRRERLSMRRAPCSPPASLSSAT